MMDPTLDPASCCVCGHRRRDHVHEPPGTVHRMIDGLCSIEGCACSCFEFARNVDRDLDIFDTALDLTRKAVDDQVGAGGDPTGWLFEPMAPPMQPEYPKDATSNERFDEYFRANPHICDALLAMARKDRNTNRRGSGQFYFEVLRRRFPIREEFEEYRLPNEYVAPYMRVLMILEPDLDGVIEIRRRTDEDRDAFERREFPAILADLARWFSTWSEQRCDDRR